MNRDEYWQDRRRKNLGPPEMGISWRNLKAGQMDTVIEEVARRIEAERWRLTAKKYKEGLTLDEHEQLEYFAAWCWDHRKPGDASSWPYLLKFLRDDFEEFKRTKGYLNGTHNKLERTQVRKGQSGVRAVSRTEERR